MRPTLVTGKSPCKELGKQPYGLRLKCSLKRLKCSNAADATWTGFAPLPFVCKFSGRSSLCLAENQSSSGQMVSGSSQGNRWENGQCDKEDEKQARNWESQESVKCFLGSERANSLSAGSRHVNRTPLEGAPLLSRPRIRYYDEHHQTQPGQQQAGDPSPSGTVPSP